MSTADGGGAVLPQTTARVAMRPWLVVVLVAVSSTMTAVAVVACLRVGNLGSTWPLLVSITAIALVGGLLAGLRPRNILGWLLLATGLPFLVGITADASAQAALDSSPAGHGALVAAWIGTWIYPPALVPLFVLIPLTFPDGRLPSRRWRGLAATAVGLAVVIGVLGAFGSTDLASSLYGHPLTNPYAIPTLSAIAAVVLPASQLGVLVCCLLATASLVFRWRRGSGETRRQIRWIVLALIVLAAAFAADAAFAFLAPSLYPKVFPLVQLSPVVVPLAIAAAVARRQLFDIDLVLSRTAVYLVLTAALLGVYAAAVTWAGDALPASDGALARLIATATVAVAFAPLRDLLQRTVGRWLYGDRKQPYVALTRLARQLQQPSTPDRVLATLVQSTATALRSPYAAIETANGIQVAEHGERPADLGRLASVELTYAGQQQGHLSVAGRGRDALTPADLRLLADLALPVAAAMHAVTLTNDLQRSRERLVLSTEDERRRIGRDLHDGLGPRLAAISMKVELVRDLARQDPDKAHALLGDLLDQTEEAVRETRRLAHTHRPLALDTLGLVPALRAHLANVTAVPVRFQAPADLPPLPAAVEVAAYRIVLEAVQNVTVHSRAQACVVVLDHDDHGLSLEVDDDGQGFVDGHHDGLGLQSMAERAAELGGTLTIGSGPGQRGTAVRAVLPFRPTASSVTPTQPAAAAGNYSREEVA